MRIGVEYNQAPQRALTFWEKYQIAELLAQYPALTLKVLYRRRVGLRRAEPSHIFVMALILFVIGYNAHSPDYASHGGLMVFAVAMGIAGYWQQFNRWRELRRGTPPPWHTYSEGISPLEDAMVWYLQQKQQRPASPATPRLAPGLSAAAPLPPAAETALLPAPDAGPTVATETTGEPKKETPEWMLKAKVWLQPRIRYAGEAIRHVFSAAWWLGESRVYRRLDPFLIYFLAWPVFFFDTPLGLWLMFAAACLSINENLHWRHQLKAYLDWHDAQIDNATMREWGGGRRGGRKVPQRSRRQTYGLPTGIGADIRARVEEQAQAMQQQRRADARAAWEASPDRPTVLPAPDNRAP